MAFGSVKVDKMSTEPLQGGSSILYLRAGTSDVDADKLGKLAMHNGQSIWITLTAPKAGAAPIDGTAEAFQRDHPDATDLFAQTHGDGGAPAEGDEADSEGGETDAGDGNWPFPRNASTESPPQSVTTEQSKRRRGARTSKEALAGASGLSD